MTTKREELSLPLEGIRVLDLTHIVAGPFCSMIFADMGAEVIKIERPGAGDRSRINTPFIDGADGQKVSVRYLGVNRNKKSVTLDLRDSRCKSAFEALVKESDILLDNWGPGALRRLDLGYDTLSKMNPGLIYASITGYGDAEDMQGPYSQWPANNPCVQGMGGWMEITGAPGGAPQMVGDNIGDTVPGVWSALGVMLALESRHKTGKGQHVDMAMYDCMVAHTTSSMPLYQLTGQSSSRARENMFSAQLALKTNDGYAVLAGAGDEEKWVALWQLLGREDLIQDPRYLGQGISGEFYFENIVPELEKWSQHLPKREVAEKLIEIGYSMGMVQNTADLDQCPHLEARKMFVDCGDTLGGSFRTANTPINLTACPETPTGPPPLLGEHNRDILCGIGRLTEEQLLGMETDRVV